MLNVDIYLKISNFDMSNTLLGKKDIDSKILAKLVTI